MALINLRNALMAGKRLPYDAEVEYLESSGTQYIDTGVKVYNDTNVEITVKVNTQSEVAFVGSATSTDRFVIRSYSGSLSYGFGVWWNNTTATLYNQWRTLRTDVSVPTVYCDGTSYSATNTPSAKSGIDSILIFDSFRANRGDVAVAGVKIWRGSTLVFDAIPVRKGTVGYLYDRVSGKLFGNAGTGDFVLGPDIVPVEYLQGDGSAYILLPQAINVSKVYALAIECKYIADVSAINRCVFASYYGSRWYTIGRIQYAAAPVIISRFGNSGQYMRTTDLNGVYTTKIIPSQDKVLENGVEYSAAFTAGLNQAIDAIGLFCAYNTNDKTVSAVNTSRIYWFNVLSVDGESIVKNLIPIRVGSGSTWEGAMMDVLTRRIYRNAGTGAFSYGNDLKYPIPA